MVKKELWTIIITLVTGGIIYGVIGLGYMHNNFASKDILSMIDKRLDRIEYKLDSMRTK